MIKSKAGKIAPYQLFFALFVSRVVVTLTYVQTVSVGKLSTDLLISILLSYCLAIVLCLPVYFCSKKNKNPFSVAWIGLLYGVYFIYFSAVNVSRFSYFATSQLNPQSSMLFFIVLIIAGACYAAIMGVEGISRFGVFCGVVLVVTVVAVVVFNLKNIEIVNLFPIVDNKRIDILKNAVVLTSNSVEPALFLALENKVNGDKRNPLFLGITVAYVVIFILILLCEFVMGAASSLQAYPIFTVFQLASIGSMSRLDIFHTAFWVLALFLKVSILLYCATICVKKYQHRTKCVISSLFAIAVSYLITIAMGTSMVNVTKIISVVTFLLFCVLVPILNLIFGKEKRIDDTVEEK